MSLRKGGICQVGRLIYNKVYNRGLKQQGEQQDCHKEEHLDYHQTHAKIAVFTNKL